jgi:DNA-binding NarL/FixJ family response regulator
MAVANLLDRLSPRRRQILELLAQGLANKEIAAQLDPPASEETVKGHLKAIFVLLDVQSRSGAVAVWLRYLGD